MNTLITSLFLIVAVFTLISWIASRPRGRQFTSLANVAEGTWEDSKTFTAEAAFASPFLLAKLGTAEGEIDVCGAADIPFGVVQDAAAIDEPVTAEFLGKGRTKLMVADAAIAYKDLVVPAAGGEVRTLPVAAGTYYVVGTAMAAQGTAGQPVQVRDCIPYAVVVTE